VDVRAQYTNSAGNYQHCVDFIYRLLIVLFLRPEIETIGTVSEACELFETMKSTHHQVHLQINKIPTKSMTHKSSGSSRQRARTIFLALIAVSLCGLFIFGHFPVTNCSKLFSTFC
jgi:hypothetical protein